MSRRNLYASVYERIQALGKVHCSVLLCPGNLGDQYFPIEVAFVSGFSKSKDRRVQYVEALSWNC